jgi:hypothetical protein
VRDYLVWWALFVFFAVLSLLVMQRRYRGWQRAKRLLAGRKGPAQAEQARRWRLEGWRLLVMMLSLLAMTGVVFAVFLAASPAVLSALRLLALVAVLGVVLLSLRL